ncbi:MAG: chlorite dismutase family protein [Phycisphaeraceae bacterium]|nr:chlorite dismutase family protein [Phycisphaeraceae bacterium]
MTDQHPHVPRTLNHYALYRFTQAYYALPSEKKTDFHRQWLAGLSASSEMLELYQVSPASAKADILVWSALTADDTLAAAKFFSAFARATAPYGHLVDMTETLWGFTKPSVYSRSRSTQEIDPFKKDRKPYLVLYPFVKTGDWYLMSGDARQGMMNEHIKLGKEYPDITQLLLYSVGLQDQEFVVVYETDDLTRFSDLVYRLRATEVRRYTERDTPLYTAVYHPAEETLALWA